MRVCIPSKGCLRTELVSLALIMETSMIQALYSLLEYLICTLYQLLLQCVYHGGHQAYAQQQQHC